MKISLNWLKKYVIIPKEVSDEDLIRLIGARLVEVEGVIDETHKYDNIYVVRVESCEKIPETHLSLCYIDAGMVPFRGLPEVTTEDEGASPVTTGASDPSPEKPYSNHLVAIGEVGLDYHYEGYNREAQIKLFEQMLQLAVDNDLPVSFHVREAFADFFAVVSNFPNIRGVVHSFTDSKKVLKRILNETDFYVGVNGLATYSTLPTPPLERTLLETDAPFLAPVPHRGETNEPSYIREIADWLSDKLGQDFNTIEKVTTKNAHDLFGL